MHPYRALQWKHHSPTFSYCILWSPHIISHWNCSNYHQGIYTAELGSKEHNYILSIHLLPLIQFQFGGRLEIIPDVIGRVHPKQATSAYLSILTSPVNITCLSLAGRRRNQSTRTEPMQAQREHKQDFFFCLHTEKPPTSLEPRIFSLWGNSVSTAPSCCRQLSNLIQRVTLSCNKHMYAILTCAYNSLFEQISHARTLKHAQQISTVHPQPYRQNIQNII